jgi:hypothetical protein
MTEKIPVHFGDAVALTWHDSRALTGWQYDPERPRIVGEIHSLGRVVQSSEYGLTITTSIHEKATIDDLTVPWGSVIEIQVLEDYSL